MTYQFRGLRCRPGDLAVIVQDEPECQANIGQLVRVVCVSYEIPDELGFHWEIQPLSSKPSPFVVSIRADKNLNESPRVSWRPQHSILKIL